MTDDVMRKYKGTVTLILPGNTKATSHPVTVDATGPTDATEKVLLAWNKATEARNIHIEEII